MQVREIMTSSVATITADEPLSAAARLMDKERVGALPVIDDKQLVGILTDRDIVVRAVAKGESPDVPVKTVMTSLVVRYCHEHDDCHEVARNMADWKVLRLPVFDDNNRIVGIVSAGDLQMRAAETCPNDGHDDSNLDEALKETFPASDPTSPA